MFVKYKQRNACSVLKSKPRPLILFPSITTSYQILCNCIKHGPKLVNVIELRVMYKNESYFISIQKTQFKCKTNANIFSYLLHAYNENKKRTTNRLKQQN